MHIVLLEEGLSGTEGHAVGRLEVHLHLKRKDTKGDQEL